MCGIVGAVHLGGGPAPVEDVRRMIAALAHRGPDGEGVLALGPAAFGHRRLAILDLSPRGAQPMRLPDTDLTVTFNGEVYDYVERRAELTRAGVAFHTDTDTEVLLRAYERWGPGCFERLNGMWAVALWDGKARRLVLSRDRFGEKPLYLLEDGEVLFFASEVKALLAARPERRAQDDAVLGRFLLTGAQDEAERTFFRDVRQLAPATTVTLDVPGRRREARTYWAFSPERARATYDYARPAETLRALLDDAVALRLRSDVPVGTCLSGGLDSSTVVALAARHTSRPVETFTAVYDDEGLDERRFARAVVERFGCRSHEVRPAPGKDLVGLLDRIGWYHDEPCSRPGLITQWSVMALAQGKVTVLLDGQGGDELLLGYSAYAVPYLRSLGREAWRHPERDGLRLKLLRDAVGLLRQPSASSGGTGSLARHLLRAAASRLRPRRGPALSPGLLAAAATLAPPHALVAPGTSRIDRLLQDDLAHRSIPALLHHEDRTSMAFGLEARVPFLDHRVVEFCLGLEFTEKVEGGLMKSVLRRAMADVLPAVVLERKDKLGYPTPVGRWLLEAAPEVKEVLLYGFAERGLVPALTVEQAWLDHERGRRGAEPWLLYRWLSTELWLRRFIDRPPFPPD